MSFPTLVDRLLTDTLNQSLRPFSPELALCATILALLFVRLFGADRRLPTYWVALGGSLVAFVFSWVQFLEFETGGLDGPIRLFTGLLLYDHFTVFFRLFLLLFAILVIALTVLSGIPDNEDGPDFYTLLLGAVVGMLLMVAANHLLVFFLAVEMASAPSFVLVGFLKGRRKSSEAALKFVVYGAGAAGVMLYGLSLLGGLLGTADMSLMASRIRLVVGEAGGVADPTMRTLALAILLVLVGLAFKLSLVPFHFWIPDAFEGAAAEVAGFLSVASKGAAFALLVRFCMALSGGAGPGAERVYLALGIGLGVIAAVTATFGNLAAYAQSNVKRLLAYSTIAHAGYMLTAVAGLLVLLNAPEDVGLDTRAEASRCVAGLLYYLSVYLFMNLGAFAVVALIRNQIFSEEIEDYNGLAQECPALCVAMLVCLFSLIGLPPLGGFVAKLFVFLPVWHAGQVHWSMYVFVCIGLLNTVFSLFYYLRVLKAMFLAPRSEGSRPCVVPFNSTPGLYVAIIAVCVIWLGVYPEPVSRTAEVVASVLFR